MTEIMKKFLIKMVLSCVLVTGLSAVDVQVSDLFGDPDPYIDQEVSLIGVMTGVCKHGGKKAFFKNLDPEGSPTIRVQVVQGSPFDRVYVGNDLKVSGTVRELRIDEAYLAEWEARTLEALKQNAGEAEHDDEHEEGGCGGCSGASCSDHADNATLKRIAQLREKLSTEERGYLSSIWIDGTDWEVLGE